MALDPVYLRGEALLRLHNGPAAVAEFQKVLDHRTITTFVTPGLAKLQLGRAYAMSDELAKARRAYQDFFTDWKNADTGLPIVREAKAEYAKLKPSP